MVHYCYALSCVGVVDNDNGGRREDLLSIFIGGAVGGGVVVLLVELFSSPFGDTFFSHFRLTALSRNTIPAPTFAKNSPRSARTRSTLRLCRR